MRIIILQLYPTGRFTKNKMDDEIACINDWLNNNDDGEK